MEKRTPSPPLVLADTEHFTAEVIDHVHADSPFDLLVPVPAQRHSQRRTEAVPPDQFTPHWPGYATAEVPYQPVHSRSGPVRLLIQRTRERASEYHFDGFVATGQHDDVDVLTRDYPDRWHVEEFFNAYQAMGWSRAGTPNLGIRYGQMTLALVAQGVVEPLRDRLGPPFAAWDAPHLAKELFGALEGDIRMRDDTIVVTYYNAPHLERLREHFEHLPGRLGRQGIDPRVPWL